MFNFNLNNSQRKPETPYKVISLGLGSSSNKVVAGVCFNVIFRENFNNNMNGMSIVMSQKNSVQNLDGCFTNANNAMASRLNNNNSSKVNNIGFFFNYNNNINFFNKYQLLL